MVSVLIFVHIISSPVWSDSFYEQVANYLRNRIEASGTPPVLSVGHEKINASIVLPRFYEKRLYQPAWIDDDGILDTVKELVGVLRSADREGLRSKDYHLTLIADILTSIVKEVQQRQYLNPRKYVDLELLLTDAFLIYSAHLLAGRINPQTIDAEWFANIRETDLADVLENACQNKDISSAFEKLMPPQAGYARLKRALGEYRHIASNGGWAQIPGPAPINTDESGKRILDVKERLRMTKELSEDEFHLPYFSKALENAIRAYQMRHGLEITGFIDEETLISMNVPVQERISQIEVNLERWRWLPQNLGLQHVIVNIANFRLDIVENDQIVNTMRVIVGKTYRRTPVFSDKMTYLVLNPYWHVPDNIARQDILPMIRKDQSYLTKKGMKIFDSWGADAREVEVATLKWSEINAGNFRFRLRQDPGPENALGRIKFMFPNQFNVYLHDTPSRELFLKTNRDFSSGCIRIEKPIELAEYVLKAAGWNKHKIEVALKRQVEQTVRLPEAIDIHLLYWTCWVDEKGIVNFRRDIYQRDKLLTEALQEGPPGLH